MVSNSEITVLSKASGILTKKISLSEDGNVIADGSACWMSNGRAERTAIADLHALAAVIEDLKPSQAIALGTLRPDLPDELPIVSKKNLNSKKKLNSKKNLNGGDAITRSQENIIYRENKPALVLLDFDRKAMPVEVQERLGQFWETLVAIVPGLREAAHLVRQSTSAGLYRTDTGEQIEGSGGMHGYVMVEDGEDVDRFLHDFHDRAWLKGYGWWMISKAGSLLERSIIDRSVGSPERLVFEAAPKLEKQLAQDEEKRRPVVYEGEVLNTHVACPPLTPDERRAVDKIKLEAKARIQPEADKVRAAYVEEHAPALAKRTGKSIEEARQIIESQCGGVLLPDVVLEFFDKELKGCTVGDVLKDPERFKDRALADPIEGVSYGRQTAKVMLGYFLGDYNGPPFINSFAHGGMRYTLATAPAEPKPEADPPPPCSLDQVLEVFNKWLILPNPTPILAVLGTVAANLLPGDPVWLGIIAPPSSAKTELLNSLSELPNAAVAEVLTPAALLSGTAKKQQEKGATGGLLRQIGDFGILLFKDFGTVLDMRIEARGEMLSALRRIFDGEYVRQVGAGGGRTMSWSGKAGLLFAATQKYDLYHSVIGTLGDRFLLVRLDPDGQQQFDICFSHVGRATKKMRKELADAVGRLFKSLPNPLPEPPPFTDDEKNQLKKTVMLAIRLRAGVERDRIRREIEAVYDPEGPARLALSLERLFAGLVNIGLGRPQAMGIIESVAMDSTPRFRLNAFQALTGEWQTTRQIATTIRLPRSTARRGLEDLVAQGLAAQEEKEAGNDRWKLTPEAVPQTTVVYGSDRSQDKSDGSQDELNLCNNIQILPDDDFAGQLSTSEYRAPFEVVGPASAGCRCSLCGTAFSVMRIKHAGGTDEWHEHCAVEHFANMADPPVKVP
jgi:hypothetical protein